MYRRDAHALGAAQQFDGPMICAPLGGFILGGKKHPVHLSRRKLYIIRDRATRYNRGTFTVVKSFKLYSF